MRPDGASVVGGWGVGWVAEGARAREKGGGGEEGGVMNGSLAGDAIIGLKGNHT